MHDDSDPGAIDGLISEADDVAGEVADKRVLDAAVIGAAQSTMRSRVMAL
jgi:ferritin-like metal-binding protein YciE